MTEPFIQYSDITFKYFAQKYPTLKNISFSIQKGEKILIVGHSGSGKSTIGNLLNGLIPFSYGGDIHGTIEIEGQSVNQMSIANRSKIIGTVLQDTDAQFLGLSVGEDIAFSLENQCVPLDEMKSRVDAVAKKVYMTDFIKQSPHELSGGQKQRTALAGILVDDVDILIFDEPLANLDPETGKYAIELIDEIHQKTDKTIIIIEHRIEDVLHRSVNKILVMDDGTLVGEFTPETLLKSNTLQTYGLREPLYVALLKLSKQNINAITHIDALHKIKGIDEDQLRTWIASIQIPSKKVSNETILDIQDVSFEYHVNKALKNISFSVKKGEMIALVGENGAGKSTLAKVICGYEVHQSGHVTLNEICMDEVPIVDRAKHVGFVMQNPNHMITKQTVKEEIVFGLELAGYSTSEMDEKLKKILEVCGLTRQETWPISALSYGQRKRVTIASILVMEPSIMILDEPTAGQDYNHYTEIMEFLKELNESYGYTIILITHDMHLMLEYTDRSIVLKAGEIIKDASSSEVLTDLDVVKKASLKETSLFHIAKRLDVNPKTLVDTFIYEEKRVNRRE